MAPVRVVKTGNVGFRVDQGDVGVLPKDVEHASFNPPESILSDTGSIQKTAHLG
jgi:hypothetical protein